MLAGLGEQHLVVQRKVIGGPAPQEVTRQIDKIEKFVADVEDEL